MKKRAGRGFSLMEVLVALFILSLALSWSLYLISDSSFMHTKIREEKAARQLLEEGLAEIWSSPGLKERLLNGEKLDLQREELKLCYQLRVFWPFTEEYLQKVKIKSQPEDLLFEIREIPNEEREKIFLGVIESLCLQEETPLSRRLFVVKF